MVGAFDSSVHVKTFTDTAEVKEFKCTTEQKHPPPVPTDPRRLPFCNPTSVNPTPQSVELEESDSGQFCFRCELLQDSNVLYIHN